MYHKTNSFLSIMLMLFIFSFVNKLYGQQSYDLEKVVPPSPTAAALGAYGDTPVSYYTGQANVSIPLCQIKTSQHQLDISMSYNSNIRVNQDASWVGLGWSLNAGGVITRSVRGIDDFDNDSGTIGQGYYYSPPLPEPDYDPEDDPMETEIKLTLDVNDGYQTFNSGPLNPEAQYIQDALEGRIDTEPDIFYFNFAGYSGSFVLGKQADGSVVYLKDPKSNLKIEIDFNYGSEFGRWTVTAPNGYIYHFETVETSENLFTTYNLRDEDLGGFGPYTGWLVDSDTWEGGYAFKERKYGKQYASSWYLDYIEAPNGERITFNYADYYGSTFSNVNISQTRYDKIQDNGSANSNECFTPDLYSQVIIKNQATKQIIQNIYLESIDFENGQVQFETTARKDIENEGGNGAQKLSGIKVYTGNKLINNIIFEHDYFNTSHQDNNLAYRFCRLKLDKIYEQGKPPYEFEYFDPNLMPSKYDKHVDDWGFYNPTIDVKYIGDTYWGTQSQAGTWLPEVERNGTTYSGTTRKPDDSGLFSRRGMLKKITYPTGGHTEFGYEPNLLKLNTPEIVESYESIASAKNTGELNNEDVYVDTFYVSSGDYKLSFWGYETYADPPMSNFQAAWLKDSQGNILETFYLTDPEGTYESKTVSLSTGTYKLEVLEIYNYALNIYLGEIITSSKYYKTVGGQRIAKITSKDSDNNVTSLKRLIYTYDGLESGSGSGVLLESHRKYEYTEEEKYYQFYCPDYSPFIQGNWFEETSASFVKRSTNSLYPIGFNSPNGIMGYRTVYEFFDENGDIGKTKYEFHRQLPQTYNSDYYTGVLNLAELTRQTKYNDIGDPVQKKETSHSTRSLNYLYSINTSRLSKLDNPCPLCPLDQAGGYEVLYNLDYSEWYVVDQVTTTEYDDDFEATLETIEEYDYNPVYKQLYSKTTYNYNGEEFKTAYYYPYNFLSNSTYQDMVNNHIVSPIVKEETFKFDDDHFPLFLYGQTKNYENIGGKVFRPTSIESEKVASSSELRIAYDYDTNGNLIEANKIGGAHIYYIWGYNEQYPIVKIENFDSNQDMTPTITNLIVSIQSESNLDDDDCMDHQNCDEKDLRTAFKNLRDALPDKCMMTAYTYNPLVGITSMTDPKGYTVYYEYDVYNRLQYTKDSQGYVLSENKYHYKN